MSIRLNTQHISIRDSILLSSSDHLHYGSKENVGFKRLYRFFHQAFPIAFNRETFQRVYNASDISKIAYHIKYCCHLKIYGALLSTSVFDINQKRQLKILMLVEDIHSKHSINIGKRLLLQLIDTCKELENIRQIYAYVEATNLDGINFYKMMGFQQKEFLQDYFSERASLTPNDIKLEYNIRTSRTDNNSIMLSPNSTKDDQESSSELSPVSNISKSSTADHFNQSTIATKKPFFLS